MLMLNLIYRHPLYVVLSYFPFVQFILQNPNNVYCGLCFKGDNYEKVRGLWKCVKAVCTVVKHKPQVGVWTINADWVHKELRCRTLVQISSSCLPLSTLICRNIHVFIHSRTLAKKITFRLHKLPSMVNPQLRTTGTESLAVWWKCFPIFNSLCSPPPIPQNSPYLRQSLCELMAEHKDKTFSALHSQKCTWIMKPVN